MDKKGLTDFNEKEKVLKNEYNCEVYKLSSKTLENFKNTFSHFFNKILSNRVEVNLYIKDKNERFIEDPETVFIY